MYLMLFAGVFLLWFLQTILIRRLWNKNLSVTLQFEDSYIYEGEKSALNEIVINDKLLFVPALGVHFSMDRSLQFLKESTANSTVSDKTYRRDVFSFLCYQKITRRLAFCGRKRGVYQIGDAEITGHDFFFQTLDSCTLPQHAQIYVYPAQIDTSRISFICKALSGMLLSRSRLHPDPFEFSGIRDYVKSDPMNHINWKASSRTGTLMVNQFDSTTHMDITILFDIDDPYILKQEELQEETIRIVSSLGARLIAQNMPVRIIGNAAAPNVPKQPAGAQAEQSIPAPERSVSVQTGHSAGTPAGQDCSAAAQFDDMQIFFDEYYPAGAGKIGQLNQKLACLDISSPVFSGVRLLELEAPTSAGKQDDSGKTYILISPHYHDEMLHAVRRLTASGRQLLWVIPFLRGQPVTQDELPVFGIPGVKLLPWETAQTSPAAP